MSCDKMMSQAPQFNCKKDVFVDAYLRECENMVEYQKQLDSQLGEGIEKALSELGLKFNSKDELLGFLKSRCFVSVFHNNPNTKVLSVDNKPVLKITQEFISDKSGFNYKTEVKIEKYSECFVGSNQQKRCKHEWVMSADSFDQSCYCKKCGKIS